MDRSSRLMEQARLATGLEDFGEPGFREGLDRLVASAEAEADLNDRGRALTVGKKSFGKGSVQTLFNLTDGSGLYVTIARYHTPSGKVIDHVGLEPDVSVDGEVVKEKEKDAQLQRAKEELENILSGKGMPEKKLPKAS